jgi:DNA primase
LKKTIKETVESYGVKLHYIGDGILRGPCPMHVNVNTPSFTVYENTDSYFCFGEGIGGDVANFISHMDGISYAEAKKIVDGEVSFQEDFGMLMDAAAVIDEVDYSAQLNCSVSKYCRDLLLDGSASVANVMQFLHKLDKEVLSKSVTRDILNSVLAESRQLRGDPK